MKHGAGGEWILASKKKSNQRGTGHVTNSLCRKDYCFKSLCAEAAATASSTRTRAVARPTPPTCLQADWYSACEPPPPSPPHLYPPFFVWCMFSISGWDNGRVWRKLLLMDLQRKREMLLKKKKEKKDHSASLERRLRFSIESKLELLKWHLPLLQTNPPTAFLFFIVGAPPYRAFPKGPAIMLLQSPAIKDYPGGFFFPTSLKLFIKKRKKWRVKVAGSLSYTENFSQTKRSSEARGEEAGTSVQELQTQSNSAGGEKKISAAPLFHDVFLSEKSLLAAEKHRVSKAGVPFVSCLFFLFSRLRIIGHKSSQWVELHFHPAGSSGVYVQMNSQMSRL